MSQPQSVDHNKIGLIGLRNGDVVSGNLARSMRDHIVHLHELFRDLRAEGRIRIDEVPVVPFYLRDFFKDLDDFAIDGEQKS